VTDLLLGSMSSCICSRSWTEGMVKLQLC